MEVSDAVITQTESVDVMPAEPAAEPAQEMIIVSYCQAFIT